jgi:hypothetical protein
MHSEEAELLPYTPTTFCFIYKLDALFQIKNWSIGVNFGVPVVFILHLTVRFMQISQIRYEIFIFSQLRTDDWCIIIIIITSIIIYFK